MNNKIMKKILKEIALFKSLLAICIGVLVGACETTELDLRVSPNNLASDQGDPNLLLNSIQLAYATNQQQIANLGAQLTRIDYMFGRDYFNNFPGSTLNGIWSRTYSSGFNGAGNINIQLGIFTNLQTLEQINSDSEIDYSFHVGVGKVLLAHSLFQLIDYVGEAAFSEAGQPLEFPSPRLDSGEEVYQAAFTLLDEAEAFLSLDPPSQGAQDQFYQGDSAKWVKLINSIRLRSYKNTENTAAFNAIIAGGNYIVDAADDFQLPYGTSELQPDDRHPDFITGYTPSGVSAPRALSSGYQSNWLMELMLENNDPRIRYYFYRQQNATPGADAPPNEETLVCSTAVPPQHYQDGGFTYCSVPNGYWGRSHGNDEGGPPDNFLRTAVGVYPAGGRFDDDGFDVVGLGLGGAGAGIEPIILSSYIEFWRGEMAANDTERANFLRSGLEKSIAKVQSFGSLDASADLSFEPDADEVTNYINTIVSDFNNATGDDKENIYAEQYFTSLYGGATEAYNYYRKTGYPNTVLPNWEPDPGPFPRTFLLPQNEVVNNPNLTQRSDLNTQVFWDTNPASPAFPPAN